MSRAERRTAAHLCESGASKVTYLLRGYGADLVPKEAEEDVSSQ